MSGKRIGYVRVSTVDQNPNRQLEDVELDKKFVDHVSAKTMNRPQLQLMLDFVREDDIIFVHSMDRLARNSHDLRKMVNDLIARKIEVRFVKEGLVFNGKDNAMSNLLLSLMGAFAEFELALIRERQAEGIAIAKAAGKFKGRKPSLDAEKLELLREEMKTRKSKAEIAFNFGVSRDTLYKYLKKIGLHGKEPENDFIELDLSKE